MLSDKSNILSKIEEMTPIIEKKDNISSNRRDNFLLKPINLHRTNRRNSLF